MVPCQSLDQLSPYFLCPRVRNLRLTTVRTPEKHPSVPLGFPVPDSYQSQVHRCWQTPSARLEEDTQHSFRWKCTAAVRCVQTYLASHVFWAVQALRATMPSGRCVHRGQNGMQHARHCACSRETCVSVT